MRLAKSSMALSVQIQHHATTNLQVNGLCARAARGIGKFRPVVAGQAVSVDCERLTPVNKEWRVADDRTSRGGGDGESQDRRHDGPGGRDGARGRGRAPGPRGGFRGGRPGAEGEGSIGRPSRGAGGARGAGARGGTRGSGGKGGSGGTHGGAATGERRGPRGTGREGDVPPRGARPGRDGGSPGERRGGPRLAPKTPRLPEPRIAEGVTGRELDREVHQQLRTLSKENAEGVAQHLVMVAALLEADELDAAMAHAETAVRRAGRVPAAREALGMVAYRQGDWARALGEFRTARRLSGSSHLLPLMVDCERGLGRLERALDLASSAEARALPLAERIELAIVVSGIRRDLGQVDAAVHALQIPQLTSAARKAWRARLSYAYAEALLAKGDAAAARDWFAKAADADLELETDAVERLAELDGVVMTDLLEGEDADDADTSSDR